MQKTKIEYADYVWNPIKGLCPVGCWYCYARKIYLCFGETIMSDYEDKEGGSTTDINNIFLADPAAEKFPKEHSRIFVCSTFELFHPIADKWRPEIFETIQAHPEHIFIILTKMPERIDRPMPANVHLGVSVTCRADLWRIDALSRCQTAIPFVSFEPLLEPVIPPNGIFSGLKWAIFGKLTGHGRKHDPASSDLSLMISGARLFGVPLFMKDNLRSIWPGRLIQEFPR